MRINVGVEKLEGTNSTTEDKIDNFETIHRRKTSSDVRDILIFPIAK